MALPDPDSVRRRTVLRSAVAVGGMSALSACLGLTDGEDELDAPAGVEEPAVLPYRQHAWNDELDTDDDGNIAPPEHHVLVGLSLEAAPDADARNQVETTLRSLERAIEWSPDGLLFTIGYTPAYFDRFDESLPTTVDLPAPTTLTSLESDDRVKLDQHDALVHLASDKPSAVLEAEEALLGDKASVNGTELDASFAGVFDRVERKTGFVGAGITRQKAEDGNIGVDAEHVPEGASLLMGFRSGFNRSQASEGFVTIDDGPFAGGSTQHVESIRLQLRTWFEQDSPFQRVAKMFSPEHAHEELVGEHGEALGTDTLVSDAIAAQTPNDARNEGMIGHAQKAARARQDGTPPLLRRDFNTLDGDQPGLHFLSLQETISDYVDVRQAMAGEDVTDGAVGRRLNNGILQYMRVESRGNYLVPPRSHRSLPTPNPAQSAEQQ